MWRRGGGGIKGGVPLGYSTLGGFTISDQLDEKSGFRGVGGGPRGQRLRGQRLSGNLDNSLTERGGSKPERRSPVGGTVPKINWP